MFGSTGSPSNFVDLVLGSMSALALAALVACAPPPAPYPSEIDILMSGQILEVDIASSAKTLLPHGAAETYIFGSEQDRGGVWCAGVAESLAYIAQTFHDIPSAVVHYGFLPDGLTHAVTLVHLEKEWWVLDSYLGITYINPLGELLLDLEMRKLPESQSSSITRDVHFESATQMNGWLTKNRDFDENNCEKTVCQITYSHEDFESFHFLVPETMSKLGKLGHPEDLAFLTLYPYGLFDGMSYHNVDSWEQIKLILKEIET